MNYRLNHIIKFNMRLSTLTKFVEFLKINTANANLKVFFFIFQAEDMLKLCLRFNDIQSIYVSKYYAYQTKSGFKICDFFNGEYAMNTKVGLLVYF